MLEEMKIVELKDEELENVSGGVGGTPGFTVEAGYYRDEIHDSAIYYFPSSVTGLPSEFVRFKLYVLDQTTGCYVYRTNVEEFLGGIPYKYKKIPDVSSITFVG